MALEKRGSINKRFDAQTSLKGSESAEDAIKRIAKEERERGDPNGIDPKMRKEIRDGGTILPPEIYSE